MTSHPSGTLTFLPVGLDVRGKHCFVVGGGDVGTRKALTLARAGASVTVICPTATAQLAEQIEAGRIRWVNESFREEHLTGAFLVVAATDDKALNAAVGQVADKCGALICDASSAQRSQVIFAASLHRDDVTVAVLTDGRDPTLARQTRDRIARLLAQPAGVHRGRPGHDQRRHDPAD